ncbi:A-kinase anchor protein 9 isoform X2 [Venturia canescens]|uniref:A-kinase anchor protein 9 isoform X2 n=1 Tax=Venturia canescens TaxID=32260 RepID=UPI001C9C6D63|nr:A-kinase anchor protein 9-like isoform X2 [Venturia canescens]
MDGDETRGGKQKSLEPGREMLAKYKAIAQDVGNSQLGEPSDEELLHNDTTGQSIDPQGTSITEGISSRDITQSSMSVSEGEGDGDLEGIAGRVAELEEMLQGKEAVVEALSAEIDHLRAEASSPNSSQSHNSSPHQNRDLLLVYHTKLQDFERAVNQRDNLIHDLTASLEQALSARDALKVRLQSMAANDLTLSMGNCTPIQDRITSLESSLIEHKAMINQLNEELLRSHETVRKLEMEKQAQSAEIDDYKTRVNQLNEKIRAGAVENTLNIAETMEMQKQYEARVDKIKKDMQVILEKFNAETKSKSVQHEEAMRGLELKYQREMIEMKGKFEEQYRNLADRYNTELPDLESKHAKELSVFQAQLSSYKKTVEALKLELVNRSDSQQSIVSEVNNLREKLLHSQKDKEMLNEQINLHKVQLDELTSKYVAAASILDSKESIERSLEEALTNVAMLKQENEALKFKHDDLSARYAAVQSLIENNQAHERSMNNRIFDLEKSLSRLSGVSVSMLSEFNETTYQTFDDVAVQFQATRQKLEERAELERQLVEKIRSLEEEVVRANDELNRTNLEKESYEKQLKDMKNTCDKLRSERNSKQQTNSEEPQPFRSSVYFDSENLAEPQSPENNTYSTDILKQIENYKLEITQLHETIALKDRENAEFLSKLNDMTEKLKQSEAECEHLKNGMAIAWEQCAEFEEKLNQTLAMNETKSAESLSPSKLERDSDGSKTSNDSYKTAKQCNITEKSIQTEKTIEENEDSLEVVDVKSMMDEITLLRKEKENLSLEMENLVETLRNLDEISKKLQQATAENNELRLENEKFFQDQNKVDSLLKSIAELTAEKAALTRELSNLADKHREELAIVRQDSSMEIEKIRNLMLTMRQGDVGLEELRNELETRHAKEMEELRTYFEEKCLQMEKQYSDEIFSQQSKKMSDNDSEIEDLAEDLYFGGGGDCSNTHHTSVDNSRNENHLPNVEAKIYNNESNAIVESGLVTAVNQLSQTEWDTALENGELTKLRTAYNNQLEEQVALAKLDIVNALQEQIQALLTVESDMEDNWPTELLELRNKFTNNAKRETEQLKLTHAAELKQLRDEHSRNVSRMVERHQEEVRRIMEERSINEENKQTEDLNSIVDNSALIRERDNLYRTCVTLKELIVDLTKYFAVCEEELNNTLISEVLKRQTSVETGLPPNSEEDNIRKDEDATDLNAPPKSPERKIKRVHFAPQCSQLVSIMNDDTDNLQSFVTAEKDLSDKVRRELDDCLKRLRSESAQVLGITLTPGESMLDVLSKQVLWTTKVNEELNAKLMEAENIVVAYQEETRILKARVMNLQQSLLHVENKKEIISEGYGEHEETGGDLVVQDFSQLQEKARHAIMSGVVDNAYLLQLIEEFCRYIDKITDEMRKEKDDLQQQVPLEPTPTPCIHRVSCRKIEAADKQLRGTRKFLEEQASEREIERDEAARQINSLQEQIKECEREKERDLRISSESSLSPVSSTVVRVLEATDINAAVETLESQLREMASVMSETQTKKAETESELKVAVDKIWVLRDIIVDLEQQIQARIEKEETLIGQIEQLEEVIAAQTKNQHELAQELDAIKMGGENSQLNEHITHLEEELRKHKLSSEHFDVNSSALKQMRIELHDMQNQLDKRTRELESLHMCGSNLSISQPSEDVSIREQIDVARCPTPDDPNSPPTLPLDLLLKLKEKLLKHARAEEVAFKRIKDLDMQLAAYKIQNEELQAEQEILQQTASEQLFQMEAMRGRLEQQKQNAPFAQRQATSRLELQLHEANAKLHSLEQTIADKELEVTELKEQLQRSNQLLQDKQKEFVNVVQTENNAIQELKDRLKSLEEEKKLLESKVGVQERAQVELPQLIDSMLADKNEEIDHLKEQLLKRDKQLQQHLSGTNIDENNVGKQCELKNSARTLSDILSINSECEDYSEAIRENVSLSHALPHNISTFKILSTPVGTKESYQVSPVGLTDENKPSIHVPRLELGSSRSPTHSSTACPRHSRVSLDFIQTADFDSKSPSSGDNEESSTNHAKTNGLSDHELDCTCTLEQQKKKTEKISSMSRRSRNFSSKSVSLVTNDQTLNIRIQDLENQLQTIKNELDVKCTSLIKRETELNALQRSLEELRLEFKETTETLTRDNIFYKNQYELSQASELKIRRDLEEVENTLKSQTEDLEEYKNMMQVNERILTELKTENVHLKETLGRQENASKSFEVRLEEKSEELKNLRQLIFDKDVTIETVQTRNLEIENENKKLYEYKTRYDQCKKELGECKTEMKRLTEGLNNRDQVIRRLEEMARRTSISGSSSPGDNKDQEIHHLQEYLKEKEKVIRQMSDDSKSLHRALETIQNKMKESGNVVELRKKLKEERRFNAELKAMVEKLKQELEGFKEESMRQSIEGADIEDMVQRELDLSARLDQQIMDVIESETEETTPRRIEKHSCNSLTIKPAEHDRTEKVMQKYAEIRQKLKQALKANQELTKQRDERDIEKEMFKAQITEYESRIFQLSAELDEKSAILRELDAEVSSKRSIVRNLEVQLQREKFTSQTAHNHDSELISQLRIKLVASLDNEERVRRELTQLRQEHKNLETRLNTARDQIELQKSGESHVLKDLLETEQTKYVKMAEFYEKEQRDNAELRETLDRVEAEKNRCEKELECANEEHDKLASSLALAEGVKDHLEIEVKRAKEELKSREEECDWLQKRIKTLSDGLAKRQQQTSEEHVELKNLRRGLSNAREVMLDLKADIDQTKSELTKANEEKIQLEQWLRTATTNENELKRKLQAAKGEEDRLKDTINDLQTEIQLSVKREMELTEELQKERFSGEKNIPAKFVQKIKELNEIMEKHAHDNNVLHEKLAKARQEREIFATRVRDLESQLAQKIREINAVAATGDMNPHMTERLQHFYGKYLRVDSRRKALAYQKRYLLCIVGGYQLSEDRTLSVLAQLTHEQRLHTTTSSNRKSAKIRFKCAALVIISIHRMKWMIHRWRTGRRVGATAVLGNHEQSFVPVRRTASNHSPPVRDRNAAIGGFSLEHYLDRFMDIQQRLGLAIPDSET